MSRPFTDFLREHRNGLTLDELADALNELVTNVTEENKGGTLTFTVSIKPMGKSDGLEVAAEIMEAVVNDMVAGTVASEGRPAVKGIEAPAGSVMVEGIAPAPTK